METTENLQDLAIPRWFISVTNESRLMLHVFTDSSSYAYGAVVYFMSSRTAYRSMVIAKNRIMPKASEKWSIPKKYLLAIGEGMRISIIAMKAIDRNIETLHIWTDYTTVYSWISNLALHTERFFANHV